MGQSALHYLADGDIGSAIKYLRQAVNLAPFIPDFRNKLAGAEQDDGQFKAARTNYEFILKENPDYASAYINYGYLLLASFNDLKNAERIVFTFF